MIAVMLYERMRRMASRQACAGAMASCRYHVPGATLLLTPVAPEMRVLDMWLGTLTCDQYLNT